ncbi:hypothetical protein C0991_003054 [Blastosporella zonata]|nr:hypothetical protein C0991_003054 [Blastosporella zonata]
MLFSLSLALLLGGSFAFGASATRKCGSTPSAAQVLAAEAHFQAHKVSFADSDAPIVAQAISVYFNVITSTNNTDTTNGYIA